MNRSKRIVLSRQRSIGKQSVVVYENGKDCYIDEDDNYRNDVVVPQWFKNLSKAWQSNKAFGAQRRRKKLDLLESTKTIADNWNQWCDKRVDMLGEECDPRIQKRKAGRPKLPDHLKIRPIKIKRSDEMKAHLAENRITVKEDRTLRSQKGLYIGWNFQINGRVKFQDEDPISVHKFRTLI